ncbi:MAG: DUF3160 domain-containing protein [bacterium]
MLSIRRSVVMLMFLFCIGIFGSSVFAQDNKRITEVDLKGKTMQELWLMRNEIFAKHGRPFKTYELFAYFMGKGYKPDKDYNKNRLSKIDLNNVNEILKKEKELLKKNFIKDDNKNTANFNNVINKFQFPEFSSEEIRKLQENGFIVTPAKWRQLYSLYENNDYAGIASFITTDPLLQLYHIFFDYTLSSLEEDQLFPIVSAFSKRMIELSKKIYKETDDTDVKAAAKRNMAYFCVPYFFLTEDDQIIPEDVKELVNEEIKRCRAHSGMQEPYILNKEQNPEYGYKVDYSQFVPRGHYTKSEKLKKYFMAMMWYGTYAYHNEYDIELLQSLLVTYQIFNEYAGKKLLIKLWKEMYDPTVLYVGLSDDLGPDDFNLAMDEVFGKLKISDSSEYSKFKDSEKMKEMRRVLNELYNKKVKIKQDMTIFAKEYAPQFRLMGQRYIPDSEVMQRLVATGLRVFPKGLDVMAVFGSRLAKELMLTKYKDDWKEWPEYPKELEKLINEFKLLKPEEWKKNLYYNWLWCLKSIIELNQNYKYPYFMNKKAYQAKSLNTALASWTELRHDTILYAKQSYGAECGGGGEEKLEWVPDPPKGFVEPNIEFYKRLEELLVFSKEELSSRKIIDAKMSKLFDRFTEVVSFLKAVSVKELENKPISISEYEQIRRFGSLLENITWAINDANPNDHNDSLSGTSMRIPLVADVHTAGDRGQVLEEAVGNGFEIYTIVEISGKLKLTRGAVFSYYEFKWPMRDRLTDEKWQKILDEGKEPALPEWIDIFFSNNEKKAPRPAYVPTPELRRKIGKEAGWQYIYYETGS